ncbi:nucleoside-diphosphate-sugar epimerase [Fluviicoccus keumensis]|uniref:Nucleoside-diphosphate-sugar epimerase n=1 Tax=Fluviicoccus keumensis TaxID=1435465 RepID=A0A4Q7ZBY6_9GAMM|nr:SDR family oxidoreductase [Fluviicoccus keumensis]RZU47641.1 nucleoside-diphosphate-sugar epimerase [Fluviicoccus keumensis]
MANVLIIGCGDTGGRLAVLLAGAGHGVTGVRRSAHALPGVTMLQADITRPFRLDIAPPDYVFILLSPGESSREAYDRCFLGGLENLQAALGGAVPRRVFFVSSTSVYGESAGEWVDEATPPRPAGFNGEVLLQAEARAAAAWPAVSVVRFAGIYGEGRLRLLRWVQAGRPVDPALWSNRIHVQDAARLLAFLLERDLAEQPLEPLYLGVDDLPVLQAEVLDWLAARRGLPPVPRQPAGDGGQGRRISNGRIRALGFRPVFPDYRAGYGSIVA